MAIHATGLLTLGQLVGDGHGARRAGFAGTDDPPDRRMPPCTELRGAPVVQVDVSVVVRQRNQISVAAAVTDWPKRIRDMR